MGERFGAEYMQERFLKLQLIFNLQRVMNRPSDRQGAVRARAVFSVSSGLDQTQFHRRGRETFLRGACLLHPWPEQLARRPRTFPAGRFASRLGLVSETEGVLPFLLSSLFAELLQKLVDEAVRVAFLYFALIVARGFFETLQ